MDKFRNWLMGLIAGRKFAYWISDDAQSGLDSLGVMGGGAAICLAKVVKEAGATQASYILDDCEIVVTLKEPQNPPIAKEPTP